jgi:RimJ/RimL family protein N-acetyltransferase
MTVDASLPTPELVWKPVLAPAPIVLAGRTVRLEPLDAARHANQLWQAVRGHDELWTWMGDPPYADEASFQCAIEEKQQAAGAVFLALVPVETGQAAGYASWMRIDALNGVVEVGNILLSPRLQRTTAATEAMYLMARHIFEALGYRRYEWKCNAENLPSRRAAERLGFHYEGTFHQHMVVKGRNRDTAWFALLDSEWPACKQAFAQWLAPANFDAAGRQRISLRATAPA